MINLTILSEQFNKIDYKSLFNETFIPFLILGLAIGGCWKTIKFYWDIIRNK